MNRHSSPVTRHSDADLPPDVVLSVRHVSKKFCRNLRRSMLYGMQDLARNMLGIRPGRGDGLRVTGDGLRVTSELASVTASRSPVTSHPSPVTDCPPLRRHEFWALQDISFDLHRGEILGLIGANGCGKSTLLRIITGVFPPDQGIVAARGRIGALIALGAGFHPHMTGRENIFLNGTVLGLTRQEIRQRFESIVAFAEIGEFLDAPVSTYSSGMAVRLGFSIAAHMNPDILLVDEVLSVGDFRFQRKCITYIEHLVSSGTSVIIVSHNLHMIGGSCSRGILLERGRTQYNGDVAAAIQQYILKSRGEVESTSGKPRQDHWLNLSAPQSGEVTIERVDVLDAKACVRHSYASDESLEIRVHYCTKKELREPVLGFGVRRSDGLLCAANRTRYANIDVGTLRGRGFFSIRLEPIGLHTGVYTIGLVIYDTGITLPHAYLPKATEITIRSMWLEDDKTAPVFVPTARWALNGCDLVSKPVEVTEQPAE